MKRTSGTDVTWDTRPTVRSRETPDGRFEIFKISTGEVLSTWCSQGLAKQRVHVINQSILCERMKDAHRAKGY